MTRFYHTSRVVMSLQSPIDHPLGAAVKASWLAEQEDRGSIPGLALEFSEIGYLLLPVEIWLKDR